MANKDYKIDELNEDELFLDDMEFNDSDNEFDNYDDDDDYYDDDDYGDYDDDGDYDEYDEYDDEDYDNESNYDEYDDVEAIEPKKKGSLLGTLLKILIGLIVVSLLGLGGFWGYNKFIVDKTDPQQLVNVNNGGEQQESSPTNESVAPEQTPQGQTGESVQESVNGNPNDQGGNVEFKYSISHAGDASDKLNRMNADFRTATSLFTQNNDLEGYKTALNNIESQRQTALAELANHESNELAEAVAAQYKEFFNGLNTAFGAKTTDQAVESFNNWNTKQNEFNQMYTQKLTSMLDQAGIEWSQTETDAGLTIVY